MWHEPFTTPSQIGEYKAALDPNDIGENMRRWWNGKVWSNPYSIFWGKELIEKCKSETSQFYPYWKEA